MTVHDTPDLYRLYLRQWVCVYSLNAWTLPAADPDPEHTLTDGISAYFESHYAGRVHDEDVEFRYTGDGRSGCAQLMLQLWNLKGEYKNHDDAVTAASLFGVTVAHHRIAARNSKLDHEIRAYGVKKLPS